MPDAEERVLVVTGGARGIGLATGLRWQRAGGVAIALDADPPADDPGLACCLRCDVTDEAQVRTALEAAEAYRGRVDAVFHNAGVLGPNRHVSRLDEAGWRRVLDVHLTGGFLVAKHAVPALRRTGGTLVFNASIVAGTGSPAYPAYAAAKAGLVSLTQSLAVLLGREGIRVNAVSPGSVPGTGLGAEEGSTGDLRTIAALAAGIPLGRAATPDDIARAVCFLLSPEARHVTGVVLPVDGGERFRNVVPAGGRG